MYTAVSGTPPDGIYENGTLVLTETPPTIEKSNVVVLFLDEIQTTSISQKRVPGSLLRLGALTGKNYDIPDDFNAPLDDLEDYM